MESLTSSLNFARSHSRSPSAATIHSKLARLERERDYLVVVVAVKQRETRKRASLGDTDGWRVVHDDDDDYNQSVGNPKRKV
jgi:hypothetical protein